VREFGSGNCFWDGQTCITYLRNPPVSDFSGDLRPFVSDAMTRAPTVLESWFLNAIITGFVIERNGSGLQLREVTAAVR
jgi:hypothetical protein